MIRSFQDMNIEGFNVAVAIDEAILRLEQLETATFVSKPADAFYSSGLAHYYDGQYDRAIEDFGEAIRLEPRYPLAYVYRGMAHDRLGQLEEAVADYGEAINLDPQGAPIYASRALVYTLMGDDAEAAKDVAMAVELGVDGERLGQAIQAARDTR